MGIIKVENIRVYAYHGCLKEETKIGSYYRVDLKVKANLNHSSRSNKLVRCFPFQGCLKGGLQATARTSQLLEKEFLKKIQW